MTRRGRSARRLRGTDAWGIDDGYEDQLGVWRETPQATRAAILAAMGVNPSAPAPPGDPPVRVVRPGDATPGRRPADLRLEDGAVLRVGPVLPRDLPLGYHELQPLDGNRALRLIVSPAQCHFPDDLRVWGWGAQIYAIRSEESWGMGDLADLRRLARWSRTELGAGVVFVNPLPAVAPVLPQEPSPYYPSSRRYRNPLYLRIDEVPGAAETGVDLAPLAAAGRALNRQRRIDRDAVFRLKVDALGRIWSRFRGDRGFDRYREEQGEALQQFATFCALSEHYGGGWHDWPAEFRHPDSPAVLEFAAAQADRVRFHAWLQWILDEQLRGASAELPVVQDLPVGVNPNGADAWAWQDFMALDVAVGAPPDKYNTRGQDWGLPPFVPHRLRAAGYEPFIQTIRATLRHAGGFRIDHALGLFRLFWIPGGLSPRDGAYVRSPVGDLLAIIALESHRARAFVVGEDLGTVEPGVRERLAEHRILSYRVVWFETDLPAQYPRLTLATVTTHDLPTVAGLWTGADLQAQRDLGLRPNEAGTLEIRERLRTMGGLADDAPVAEVIRCIYRLLAEAPSAVLMASLDDALAVEERPNMPATSAERPNWAIALPVSLDALERDPLTHAIGQTLRRRQPTSAEKRRARPD